jgi:hypothetical protein
MNEPPAGAKTPWETAWETRGDGMLLTPKQYAMLAAAYARPRSDVSLEVAQVRRRLAKSHAALSLRALKANLQALSQGPSVFPEGRLATDAEA